MEVPPVPHPACFPAILVTSTDCGPYMLLAMRILFCVAAFGAGSIFARSADAQGSRPSKELLDRGKTVYTKHCVECHGDRGQGVEGTHEDPLVGDRSIVELAGLITRTMPEGEADRCVGREAEAVAVYIHDAFYSEAARTRNNPPRIRLTHLTGNQLRQSLADMYGQFTGAPQLNPKRGLEAVYYDGARPRNDKKKIERIDPNIDFDWKLDGPGEGINAKDFFIRWRGGLRILETGRYEIVIRSSCAFILSVGRYDRELINNRVQSGDKTEFRKSITLTAGRVYPIQIDLFQRKRKTEQPPAKITLSWVPPHESEVVIPNRFLVPGQTPPAWSLQTKLPPDDRSYGFERGLAVDRQWDASTTASAAEFSQIAVDDLWPDYQRRNQKGPDENRATLRGFLAELVGTAFRGPLDDAAQKFYIDAQIAATPDDAEAIKRSLLVTLKSPRFLYPDLDRDRSTSQRAANRLALTLFDSLPSDQWLAKLVEQDNLQTEDQIRQAARRMLSDPRVRGKTRELMYDWLSLSYLHDLTKNEERFPGFSPEIVADLKASLDASIDDVVWNEASDFRQLFLADRSFTTPRLGQFYGAAWKAEEPSGGLARTVAAPQQRAGLITHPYLMSGLAYQDSTSPIHRGVFLIRYVLGRTLNPPKEAFTPLSPDLHPELTTRQRIEKQTSPESCQVCHMKINALGFALENFDAVGRFRENDAGRKIDPAGFYVTRQGQSETFRGAFELAEFLASSHDVHRAFVNRAFQHFVKQPVAAYGVGQLDELTEKFRQGNFNIQNLLVEIAVIAATQPETK